MQLEILYRDGMEGVVDRTGRVVVPFIYSMLGCWSEGLISFQVGDDIDEPAGVLDESGRVVVPARFNTIGEFAGGLASASDFKVVKTGYITPDGQWAIPPQFEGAFSFDGGVALAKSGGQWGLIDTRGSWLIEPSWDEVRWDLDEVIVVKRGKKWGAVRRDGSEAVPFKFVELAAPFGGRIGFRRGKTWGYLDYSGKVVIKNQFDEVRPFWAKVAASVRKGDAWGLIDPDGELLLPAEYEAIGAIGEGLVPVRQGGKSGYVDLEGNIVLPLQYDSAREFADGTALVDQARFIDRRGKVVAEIDFDAPPAAGPPPEPTDEDRLAYDASDFGPYLRAALAVINSHRREDSPYTEMLEKIELRYPDQLKAFLQGLAAAGYFLLDRFESTVEMLRFQPSKRRVRIGLGDFGVEYWVEWSPIGGNLTVLQVLRDDETGRRSSRGWGDLDAFFCALWERGLDRLDGGGSASDEQCDREFGKALTAEQG